MLALHGGVGRVLLALTPRALVRHVHQEYQIIFHNGGGATAFRVGEHLYPLRNGEMILVNPWENHEKLADDGEPALLVSVLIRPTWLHRRLYQLEF